MSRHFHRRLWQSLEGKTLEEMSLGGKTLEEMSLGGETLEEMSLGGGTLEGKTLEEKGLGGKNLEENLVESLEGNRERVQLRALEAAQKRLRRRHGGAEKMRAQQR